MNLSPVLISVYSRIEHLKKCIEALRINELANKTILYIVSDYAYRTEDKKAIESVRKYITTITGFKEVIPILREKNYGAHESIYQAINYVLEKYGKIIFMEDDIVTSRNFLSFMNGALHCYENNDNILTITGYTPPFKIPKFYKKDIWVNRRHCAWGFATWHNKWSKINFSHFDRYSKIKNHKKNLKKYIRDGEDLLYILKSDSEKEYQAMDIRICYHQLLFDQYTVYPVVPLSKNNGFDGTGLRCNESSYYDVELCNKKVTFKFPDNPKQSAILKLTARSFYEDKAILDILCPKFYKLFRKVKTQLT